LVLRAGVIIKKASGIPDKWMQKVSIYSSINQVSRQEMATFVDSPLINLDKAAEKTGSLS
jgi:hypothetical protein